MADDADPVNVYGYVRVSTRSQSYEIQVEKIQEYCKLMSYHLIDVFKDKMSGKDTHRPDFQRMLALLEDNPNDVKAVVIYKLDRLGRSLKDLINITEFLKTHKIGLVSVMNNINTMTKEGRLMFYILGVIAEYDRESILERTAEGREWAKEHGVKFGRTKKKIPIHEIHRKIADGVPKTRIARDLKISTRTLYNRLDEDAKEE
jgi:DNA invertase Pin-like site-specific DNA recombinase